MFPLYSFLLSLGFLLMLPLFYLRKQKYAAGFNERLGNYPEFGQDGRPVIWLHCVSVGEANAARPLVNAIRERFREHRLVISTTTRTGQDVAHSIFKGHADAVFYFPFDWKFSVRRALDNFRPAVVLLMETEIWPRFIHEAKITGAKVAIVNGRLSERSFRRYSKVTGFVSHVLSEVDLALMQDDADAGRIISLGMDSSKVGITGNQKFDFSGPTETPLTGEFRRRFGLTPDRPLIVAASTHEPEERLILEALDGIGREFRLLIAPRHPERFEAVAEFVRESDLSFARRSAAQSSDDQKAQVILLDSIGELRAVYPLAEIVFVGGSLIPHGGQSVLEPAAAGKAIVTGPYTHNFDAVVREFLRHDALIQLPDESHGIDFPARLFDVFTDLLSDPKRRAELGEAALRVMESNRGATVKTMESLERLITEKELITVR